MSPAAEAELLAWLRRIGAALARIEIAQEDAAEEHAELRDALDRLQLDRTRAPRKGEYAGAVLADRIAQHYGVEFCVGPLLAWLDRSVDQHAADAVRSALIGLIGGHDLTAQRVGCALAKSPRFARLGAVGGASRWRALVNPAPASSKGGSRTPRASLGIAARGSATAESFVHAEIPCRREQALILPLAWLAFRVRRHTPAGRRHARVA